MTNFDRYTAYSYQSRSSSTQIYPFIRLSLWRYFGFNYWALLGRLERHYVYISATVWTPLFRCHWDILNASLTSTAFLSENQYCSLTFLLVCGCLVCLLRWRWWDPWTVWLRMYRSISIHVPTAILVTLAARPLNIFRFSESHGFTTWRKAAWMIRELDERL